MKIFGLTIGRTATEVQPKSFKEKAVTIGTGILEMFERQGLQDTTSVSSKLLEANTGWVYANVSAIAQEVSKMKPVLHRVRIIKGDIVFDPILSHPILDLLDRFNEFTTASEAFYLTEAHIELAGDTFYLLDGSGANIKNLFILAPDKITLNIGGAADNYRVVSYTYKDTIDGKPIEVKYDYDEIIHIKEPNPANPYRGKSVVASAATAIDTDNLSNEWTKNFFLNAAIPNFALTTDQRLTKDQKELLEKDVKMRFRGAKNAGKTLIMWGGLKPVNLQMTNRDMEFLALQEWLRDKIMAMFKNTKVSLGIVDDVNRASAEESMLTWKQGVIKPKMMRIMDALNEFLVPRYGSNLLLGFEDPVPENRTEKIDEVVKLKKDANIISINEARQMLELDPIKGKQYDEIVSVAAATGSPNSTDDQKIYLPRSVKMVDYVRVLRRNKIFERAAIDKNAWMQAKSLAKVYIKQAKGKKKENVVEPRESRFYTNDQVWEYWAKQIQLSESVEKRFENTVQRFLDNLTRKALTNLDAIPTKKWKKKQIDLFDQEVEVRAAIDLLTPLLEEMSVLAAEQVYQLLNMDTSYVITNRLKEIVGKNTNKLANKFIATDIEKLNQIIASGIESGDGIPAIERAIRKEFDEFTKVQTSRIARTEVMRASNAGAIDAFEESGIVEFKQWLTAMDDRVDPICASLNGKIIKLRRKFFTDDYASGQEPPIHPNCRCVVLPVLKDIKAQEIDVLKQQLEAKEKEYTDLSEYAEKLEAVAGVADESGS